MEDISSSKSAIMMGADEIVLDSRLFFRSQQHAIKKDSKRINNNKIKPTINPPIAASVKEEPGVVVTVAAVLGKETATMCVQDAELPQPSEAVNVREKLLPQENWIGVTCSDTLLPEHKSKATASGRALPHATVRLPGHEMVGGVLSTNNTLYVQETPQAELTRVMLLAELPQVGMELSERTAGS